VTTSHSSPSFARLCIVVLALEWVVFGSMHFFFFNETVAQIPCFIPSKQVVAVVTGLLEIAIGISIMARRTRKLAAALSCILIVLYIPAVFRILWNDLAFPAESSVVFRSVVRLLIIPNNVFLAFCSVYLWRSANATFPDAARPRPF